LSCSESRSTMRDAHHARAPEARSIENTAYSIEHFHWGCPELASRGSACARHKPVFLNLPSSHPPSRRAQPATDRRSPRSTRLPIYSNHFIRAASYILAPDRASRPRAHTLHMHAESSLSSWKARSRAPRSPIRLHPGHPPTVTLHPPPAEPPPHPRPPGVRTQLSGCPRLPAAATGCGPAVLRASRPGQPFPALPADSPRRCALVQGERRSSCCCSSSRRRPGVRPTPQQLQPAAGRRWRRCCTACQVRPSRPPLPPQLLRPPVGPTGQTQAPVQRHLQPPACPWLNRCPPPPPRHAARSAPSSPGKRCLAHAPVSWAAPLPPAIRSRQPDGLGQPQQQKQQAHGQPPDRRTSEVPAGGAGPEAGQEPAPAAGPPAAAAPRARLAPGAPAAAATRGAAAAGLR
jgi:hypothetical protein